MIKEFEYFHGCVLARVVHDLGRPVSCELFSSEANSSYVLDGTIGIYIKYSGKRLSPWSFTFTKDHQAEIDLMKKRLAKVFLLLVCNDDGIVCLKYSEIKKLFDEQPDPIEWVTAKRSKRQMYTVKGSNGQLDFKVGQNEFPGKLFHDDFELTTQQPSPAQAKLYRTK